MGNKGQYSTILYDKEANHYEGLIYLNKKLNELQNNDMLKLEALKGR